MAHTGKGSIANFRAFAMTPTNAFNVDIYLSKLHHAFDVEACDQLVRMLCE